jgi:hypothetical protein
MRFTSAYDTNVRGPRTLIARCKAFPVNPRHRSPARLALHSRARALPSGFRESAGGWRWQETVKRCLQMWHGLLGDVPFVTLCCTCGVERVADLSLTQDPRRVRWVA